MIARFIIESESIEEKLNEEKNKVAEVKRDFKVVEVQNDVDKDYSKKEISVDEDIDEDELVDYGELSI